MAHLEANFMRLVQNNFSEWLNVKTDWIGIYIYSKNYF